MGRPDRSAHQSIICQLNEVPPSDDMASLILHIFLSLVSKYDDVNELTPPPSPTLFALPWKKKCVELWTVMRPNYVPPSFTYLLKTNKGIIKETYLILNANAPSHRMWSRPYNIHRSPMPPVPCQIVLPQNYLFQNSPSMPSKSHRFVANRGPSHASKLSVSAARWFIGLWIHAFCPCWETNTRLVQFPFLIQINWCIHGII